MKRYKQDYRGDFYEAPDGPWVKYDHIAALKQDRDEWRDAHHERQSEYLERKGACIVAETELARLREAMEHALGHADKPDEVMAILRHALAAERGEK